MLEQERKRECFPFGQGYLFVSLARNTLMIEYIDSNKPSEIYQMQYKQQLPGFLKESFNSLAHLYKYLSQYPHQMLSLINKNQLNLRYRKGSWSIDIILKLQKIKSPSTETLIHHKILILNDQKRDLMIKQKEIQIQANHLQQQLSAMLTRAKQLNQNSQIKLNKKRASSRLKMSEKSRLQLIVRQKQKKITEHRQKMGSYLTIDD